MVYIITSSAFPYGMAGTNHIICEAKGLLAAGVNVKIVITDPVLRKTNDNELPPNGQYEGISYNYINGKFMPENRWQRFLVFKLNIFLTFIWLLKNLKNNDIAYHYEWGNTINSISLLAAKIKGAKFVREMVELPYVDNTESDKRKRWREEHFLIPYYDGIVCISHGLMDYCKMYVGPRTQLHLQPILVETLKKNYSKSQYQVPYIIHSGSMSERKDGISYILRAFAKFKESDTTGCRLVFTGPDSQKNKCIYLEEIEKLGISDYVDLLGMIEKREALINLLHFAAMSIVYKMENIQTSYCFATKIGEIVEEKIPLIITNACENKFYFKNKENAFVVEPGNVEELSHTISFILNNPIVCRDVVEAAYTLAVKTFSPLKQGKRLKLFFDNL